MFRIQHGSWTDTYDGQKKIKDLVDAGWIAVNLFQRDFERHQAYLAEFRNIHEWVKENIGTGAVDWYCIDQCWLFKNPNHAMLFKLTWAGI